MLGKASPMTARTPSLLTTRREGDVAVIDIAEGMLIDDAAQTDFTRLMGFALTSQIVDAIDQAARDPSAAAIILAWNVRGGMVACIEPVMDAIRAARRSKRVLAHGRGRLGGAGYIIATAAESISADENCLIGIAGCCILVPVDPDPSPRPALTRPDSSWRVVQSHPSILAPLLKRTRGA